MRQNLIAWLSALGCLSAVALPSSSEAAPVWTAGFEKGDLSEWRPGINDTTGTRKNVEVLGEQVYTGQFAGKITVHPDDTFTFGQNRVDIQHPSTLTAQGKESWLSGHYMMPADAKVRNEIGFYESNSTNLNAMDFWVAPKTGGGTTINFGVGDLGKTKLWTADFTIGVWHQIGIHVLWSTNAQTGTIDIWFDGTQVVTAAKAATTRDTNTLYYQTGLHRTAVAQFIDVIYLDDFIEADNLADVKIAPPLAGDGGVAVDASGGAGGGSAGDGGGTGGSGGASMDGGAAGTTAGGGSSGAGGASGSATTTVTGTTTSGAGGGTNAATATTGGTNVTTGGSGGSVGAMPASNDGGCSCTLPGGRHERLPRWAALAAMLGVAMATRRRRRVAMNRG